MNVRSIGVIKKRPIRISFILKLYYGVYRGSGSFFAGVINNSGKSAETGI